jgi:tRNA(Arg) A34 adenosine deaminase TadA
MVKVIALAEANVSSRKGGPFAAAVIETASGKIVSMVANRVFATCDPTAHAEVSAIRDACQLLQKNRLTGHVLYTSCYPCPMCYGAIRWSGLEAVYYGATAEDATKVAGFADSDMYSELR